MQILIIEDELHAFDILQKRILKLLNEATIVGHLKSIVESINWFKQHPEPDLVFLDVELADGQSFEIFNHLSLKCPVIFTTAYDQYAIKAFSLNSIAYLLKPISTHDLQQAIQKYQTLKDSYSTFGIDQMKQLMENRTTKKRTRFLVNSGEKYFFVKTHEIAYFYAEDGLTFIKTLQNKRHLINETLDQVEQELDNSQFFRINRQQILHIEAIQAIHEYFNRRFKVDLFPNLSEHEFIVSRLRRTEFKNWLNGR